jgi:hypothetical protein
MQDETLITLKDILIPALSIIVAGGSVYLSHRQMRLQIKKNMRVQHIDRIRDEVSEFISQIIIIEKTKNESNPDIYFQDKVVQNITRIILLLDDRKPMQKKLGTEIRLGFRKLVEKSREEKATSFLDSIIYAAHAAIQELEDEI